MDIDIDDKDAMVPFDADDTGGTAGVGCDAFDVPLTNAAAVVVDDDVAFVLCDVEFTAAAAAVAYRKGNAAGGFGGNPFFTILAIGADAKFGFGGGLDANNIFNALKNDMVQVQDHTLCCRFYSTMRHVHETEIEK